MLKGKKVNLRAVEREDLDLLTKWFNDSEFVGRYQDFPVQTPKYLLEKQVFEPKIPELEWKHFIICLLYTSPSPRDRTRSRMPSSA